MSEFITVIIKDGNRTVNWEISADTSLEDVLKKWAKGYSPVQSGTVYLNDAKVPEEIFGCHLSAFAEDKAVIRLHTVFPKKGGDEE